LSAGPLARWRALDRGSRVALAGIALLVAGAVAVRVWLMAAYGPAFLGFGDSHEYVTAAATGVFRDVQKPAGYPILLAVLHAVSDGLTFTILVQHLLGLATGVLLYLAVRSAGGPPWLGLIPAATVFFGGTGVLLEHSLLADPLFAFLQAVGVYAAVRALSEPGVRWASLAGLATGASFWVKTVGLSSVVLVPLVLLLAAPLTPRRRQRSALAAGAIGVVLVCGYLTAQGLASGYWGYERQGAWNLYGRVATFVDCARFTPPPGTRFLCPIQPPDARSSQSYYQYARFSPAVRRFGGPARAPAYANGMLERFSLAAIAAEPLAYAGAVLHGLTFYVSPGAGEGYTPAGIREALLSARGTRSIEPAIAAYYRDAHGYAGSRSASAALDAYERHTRIQGLALIAMLLAAIAGLPLLSGRARAAALLFTLTAICSVLLAELGNGYDARYGYPAFGPLAAGAALGAWGIARHLRRRA
jgi:hypothetical protein